MGVIRGGLVASSVVELGAVRGKVVMGVSAEEIRVTEVTVILEKLDCHSIKSLGVSLEGGSGGRSVDGGPERSYPKQRVYSWGSLGSES